MEEAAQLLDRRFLIPVFWRCVVLIFFCVYSQNLGAGDRKLSITEAEQLARSALSPETKRLPGLSLDASPRPASTGKPTAGRRQLPHRAGANRGNLSSQINLWVANKTHNAQMKMGTRRAANLKTRITHSDDALGVEEADALLLFR